MPAAASSGAVVSTTATSTSLTVTPSSGAPYQSVTVAVVVAAETSGDVVVTIRDGSAVIASGLSLVHHAASITTNALGPGRHVLTAEIATTVGHRGSVSAPSIATYGTDQASSDTPVGAATQSVVVTIPTGSLSITTPYTVDRPLVLGSADLDQTTSTFAAGALIAGIAITDTRAGNRGFAASVSSSRFVNSTGDSFAAARAGFVDLAADQILGNAMLASDVRVVDVPPAAPGLGLSRVFATYPAGRGIGTVRIHGSLVLKGVPSSVRAGQYRATLTFTAF